MITWRGFVWMSSLAVQCPVSLSDVVAWYGCVVWLCGVVAAVLHECLVQLYSVNLT